VVFLDPLMTQALPYRISSLSNPEKKSKKKGASKQNRNAEVVPVFSPWPRKTGR